jgi:respiratory burst oxidase
MQNMETEGVRISYPGDQYHHHSDSEITESESNAYSGPLSGPLNKRAGMKSKSSASCNICDDSVAAQSVKTSAVASDLEKDPQLTSPARGLEKRTSFGSSVVRSASARITQVSQELKRLTSFLKRAPPARFDRTKSAAAQALKGLKFISKTDDDAGWPAVEKQFNKLTASTNGSLPRSLFGKCIVVAQPYVSLSLSFYFFFFFFFFFFRVYQLIKESSSTSLFLQSVSAPHAVPQ